jgi:hypothetical protein
MSASLAFGSPVEQLVGDELVRFPKLNMRELAVLMDAITANRVAKARAAAVEQGNQMTGPEKAGFIAQAAVQPVTDQNIYEYLGTRPGIDSALKTSLGKAGKQEAEAVAIIDQLDYFSASALARVLAGAISFAPSDKIGKPEERDWSTERLLVREFCPNLGPPEELTREQYEQSLEIAKMRHQAKQQAAQQAGVA